MKYVVNEKGIGCGLCASTCPEYFTLTDEGVAKAMDAEVPVEVSSSAAMAEKGCPVNAIEEAQTQSKTPAEETQ